MSTDGFEYPKLAAIMFIDMVGYTAMVRGNERDNPRLPGMPPTFSVSPVNDPIAMIEKQAQRLRSLGARRIGVFGSFARGDTSPESDIDIYLEFEPGKKNYDNFFAIYELLTQVFGRRIDLVTEGALSERKARIILPTARYAAIDS